jgi:SAM-dependent methyltransferase
MHELDRCPGCGAGDPHAFARSTSRPAASPADDWSLQVAHMHRHVIHREEQELAAMFCPRCGLIYLSPTFDDAELGRLYSHDTWLELRGDLEALAARDNLSLSEVEAKGREFRPRFVGSRIQRFVPGPIGSLVDYGGGDGLYLRELDAPGRRRFVYDLALPDRLEPGVEGLGNERELIAHAPYDLVLTMNTMEHVTFPGQVIELFRRITRPGAHVYVEVPYEFSGLVYTRKVTLNYHINFFSRISLANLFRIHGFRPVSMEIAFLPVDQYEFYALVAVFRREDAPLPLQKPGLAWKSEVVEAGFRRVRERLHRRFGFARVPWPDLGT